MANIYPLQPRLTLEALGPARSIGLVSGFRCFRDLLQSVGFSHQPKSQWIGLRENLQESPMIFMGKSMVSCRFSLKPIHWILHHTTHSQIPFLPAQSCFEPCPAVILSHVCWAYNSIFKTTTITPSLVYNICVQSVYILYIYICMGLYE